MRVCFLVITQLTSKRWRDEYSLWKKIPKTRNVDVYFLQCQKDKYDCTESFTPGIFQKTILGLEQTSGKYDIFVRTNLSTFFNIPKCLRLLRRVHKEYLYRPLYGGMRDERWGGFQGTGIFLNQSSVNILIEEGRYPMNYNSSTPDDILISLIMAKHLIEKSRSFPKMYIWDAQRSFRENICQRKYHIYTRMKYATDADRLKLLSQNADTSWVIIICICLCMLALASISYREKY
jgi:hypothetical protein